MKVQEAAGWHNHRPYQDHLMNAMVIQDLAGDIVELYRRAADPESRSSGDHRDLAGDMIELCSSTAAD